MNKFLIYFFIGFIAIFAASFLLPVVIMNYGVNGLIFGVIGFIILVLVIVISLMKFAKSGLNTKDIPNGLPATATVVSCRQGNFKMTFGGVQDVYQLLIEVNVQNPQGESWPATIKAMIPLTQIATFQPGVSFLVKYDPLNKNKVIIDQNATAAQTEVNFPGYGNISQQTIQSAMKNAPQDITLRLQASNSLMQELKISGVATTATIISNELMYPNYIPSSDAIQLKLQVNANDRPSFEAEILSLIAKIALPKVEAGKTVYVKYDRNNPQRLVMTGTDQPNTAQAI